MQGQPPTVQLNDLVGNAWERDVVENQLPLTHDEIRTQITIRSRGPSGKKVTLPTEITREAVEARFPSEQLPDAIYELRAEVIDRAGNGAETTLRAATSEVSAMT